MTQSNANILNDLRQKMGTYFDRVELEIIAFDFNIDAETLRQRTKSEFILDLIRFFRKDSRIVDLVSRLENERPHVTWPDVSKLDSMPTQFESFDQPITIIQGDIHMGDTINMDGDFRGSILNVKSKLENVQQSIGAMEHASDTEKDDLKKLFDQLKEEIENIPDEKVSEAQEDAEAVAQTSEALVEMANSEKPNKTMIQITGEGLKKAAENLKEVAPTILVISAQIVATIQKMAGM